MWINNLAVDSRCPQGLKVCLPRQNRRGYHQKVKALMPGSIRASVFALQKNERYKMPREKKEKAVKRIEELLSECTIAIVIKRRQIKP